MRLRALVLVSIALATRPSAQGYWEELVSPYPLRVTSPSKEWVLEIDSTKPQGEGAGRYRLERNGALAWEAEHPFTLYAVDISNDGVIAGFAWAGGEEENEMVLAVIDGRGEFRLRDVRTRAPNEGEFIELHTEPTWYPEPQGVLLDPANDRALFRVKEIGDKDDAHWYVHRLSDGARTAAARPQSSARSEYRDALGATHGWRLVPDTDLVLVEWTCYSDQDSGVYFALIGPSLREVWSLCLPRDHNDPEAFANADVRRMFATTQIVAAAPNGAFSVASVGSTERIDLRAVRDASAETGWRIEEVGREPVAGEGDATLTESAAEPSGPPGGVTLELLARVKLQAEQGNQGALGVRDFDVDDGHRAGWIRRQRDGGPPRFALFDLATGQMIRDFALSAFDPSAGGARAMVSFQGGPHAVFVGGERWVVIAADGERSSAWWLDAGSGAQERIEAFDTDTVESAARLGDGGFAVLTHRIEGTAYLGLIGFGPDGGVRWRHLSIPTSPRDPGELFSPVAIALLPTGELAVLRHRLVVAALQVEGIVNEVQLFTTAGKWLRTIGLEQALGRKLNYPSGICADALGFALEDFNGEPPLVRMSSDGKVLASFVPRHGDGRPIGFASMRVDPEGRMWVSDGDALMRLDENGTVDLAHGAAATPEELGDIAIATVDHLDRVLVRDKRTKTIHGFDAQGSRALIATPLPEDIDRLDYDVEREIEVATNGDVYVSFRTKDESSPIGTLQHLRFTGGGRRIGFEPKHGLDPVRENWFFQPNAERHWVVTGERLYLAEEGSEPVAIERGPDGRWLKLSFPHRAAVAHDGSVALPATTIGASGEDVECVHLYRADGEPWNTVLPGLPPFSVSNALYTGDRLLFPEKDRTAWTVFDLDGAPLGRYVLPVGKEELGWAETFVAARGRELWVVSLENRELWRFALP